MGIPGVTPRPVAEQAKLLRKLGYDGIALEHDAHLASNLKVLDDAGLPLYMSGAYSDASTQLRPMGPPQIGGTALRAQGGRTGAPISVAESQKETHPELSSNPVAPT